MGKQFYDEPGRVRTARLWPGDKVRLLPGDMTNGPRWTPDVERRVNSGERVFAMVDHYVADSKDLLFVTLLGGSKVELAYNHELEVVEHG